MKSFALWHITSYGLVEWANVSDGNITSIFWVDEKSNRKPAWSFMLGFCLANPSNHLTLIHLQLRNDRRDNRLPQLLVHTLFIILIHPRIQDKVSSVILEITPIILKNLNFSTSLFEVFLKSSELASAIVPFVSLANVILLLSASAMRNHKQSYIRRHLENWSLGNIWSVYLGIKNICIPSTVAYVHSNIQFFKLDSDICDTHCKISLNCFGWCHALLPIIIFCVWHT